VKREQHDLTESVAKQFSNTPENQLMVRKIQIEQLISLWHIHTNIMTWAAHHLNQQNIIIIT